MITHADLSDFRRAELESPELTKPPVNFLPDLETYLRTVQDQAGPRPSQWDPECEALAAMELLDEIFRLRRQKIECMAGCITPDTMMPLISHMFVFEANVLTRLALAYEDLDKTYGALQSTGKIPNMIGE